MTSSSWQQTESDNSSMRLHLSAPDGAGPFPAMVVIQHQGGVDEFVRNMTERLAGAGYLSVAPDLYHRDGPDCKDDLVTRRSRLSDRRIINDINATVGFLQNHSAVDAGKIGIIGFCMGGRVVYLMAAAIPAFKAAVAYYPGNTFRAWGRIFRRRLNGARKFIVRSRATLAPTMAIRRPKTWRSSTPS